jgi:hypothetical protein
METINYDKYRECIEACLNCAATCNYCAASCLNEKDVNMMAACIRLDMECAAICTAAAQVMSMNGTQMLELCTICADICDACAAECGKHQVGHCQKCAEVCHNCASLCRQMTPA